MHFEFKIKLSENTFEKFLFQSRILLKSSDLTNNIFNERVMYLCHNLSFNTIFMDLSKN